MTARSIWDYSGQHKQSISLHGEYDASILVQYHSLVSPAIVFFNILFIAVLH